VESPAFDPRAWRSRIPLLAHTIAMNNCSQAPQSDATRAAAVRYLDSWDRTGMDWDAWMDEVRLAREAFARLIGADTDEVAVMSSVSEAASAVASALDFSGRRRIIAASGAEFPTVGQVWLAQAPRGADVRWANGHDGAVPSDAWDALLSADTAVVSAAHGWFLNGALQDVGTLARQAHEHGALIFVDAYQTAGAVPIDVHALDVDFLASGCLKYLMGIPGIAFLYVRRALHHRLHPTMTGWFGRANPFAFDARRLDWAPSATRFELGTPPILNAMVARAGIELVMEVGVDRIRACHVDLGRRLIEGGRARGLTLHGTSDAARKTASTAFLVRDSHAVEGEMRKRGVLPSARGPVIRLAPHFYTTEQDVDLALDVLVQVVAAG
jgi:selenocysteine lyase/cysteine desulfurase